MIQANTSKAVKRLSHPITGNVMALSNQTSIFYPRQQFRPMPCVPEEHSQHLGSSMRSLFARYYADDLSSDEVSDMIPMQQGPKRKIRSERRVKIAGTASATSSRVSLQELLLSRKNAYAKQVKPKTIPSKHRRKKRCGIRHLFGFGTS